MFSFHDSEKCQVLYFNQYIHIVELKIVETGFLCISLSLGPSYKTQILLVSDNTINVR